MVFGLALAPFLYIVYGVFSNALGPDPAEALMHQTGEWAIRLLVLVLAARPLAQWGWPALFRYRRMLGLFMFFYTTLHLLVFAQVYVGWNVSILLEELLERPYVMVGFAVLAALAGLEAPLCTCRVSVWRANAAMNAGWFRRTVETLNILPKKLAL